MSRSRHRDGAHGHHSTLESMSAIFMAADPDVKPVRRHQSEPSRVPANLTNQPRELPAPHPPFAIPNSCALSPITCQPPQNDQRSGPNRARCPSRSASSSEGSKRKSQDDERGRRGHCETSWASHRFPPVVCPGGGNARLSHRLPYLSVQRAASSVPSRWRLTMWCTSQLTAGGLHRAAAVDPNRGGGWSGAPASRIGESTSRGAPLRNGDEVGEAAQKNSVRPSPGWTTGMANTPPRGGRSVATRAPLGVAIRSIRGVPPSCQRGNTKKLRSSDGRQDFAAAARLFAASHKRASAVGSMPSA